MSLNSQNCCCVPGCSVTTKDGVPLHRFPNPETNPVKFKSWITNIGGDITRLDHGFVYINKRVCHRHFKGIDLYPKNRLCKLAIPVLNTPGDRGLTTPPLDVQNITSDIIISGVQESPLVEIMEIQPPTSGVQNISDIKISGIHISLAQEKEYKSLLKKLKKIENKNTCLKKKYILAKKLTKTAAFDVISKNMANSASLFCKMQMKQSTKAKQGDFLWMRKY